MPTPNVLILRGPGTNCDRDAEFAFNTAGGRAERLHIQALRENPTRLRDFQILVCPGGFSYGDDVGSGKIMASQLEHFLADAIREFRDEEKLILGICNGFQIERMFVPMAHGEGNFVCRKDWILKGLGQAGQVVLRYTDPDGNTSAGFPHNPNGSQDDVAGVCDATGRVMGLMPHPERHALPTQHPRWTREGLKKEGDGMQLFRNAVEFFK